MPLEGYPKSVTLKDGRTVTVRPLQRGDFQPLYDFFRSLPEGDRTFLRDDVADPDVVRRWTEQIDFNRVVPLVAEDGKQIVADGTLHVTMHGWMRHVGYVRLVIAPSHRRAGLGAVITHELVQIAEKRGLEKLQADCIEDNRGAVKMFQRAGFDPVAVIKGMVKDQHGHSRNLVVMVNDVARLSEIMELWIQDLMIAAHRVPGGDEG